MTDVNGIGNSIKTIKQLSNNDHKITEIYNVKD